MAWFESESTPGPASCPQGSREVGANRTCQALPWGRGRSQKTEVEGRRSTQDAQRTGLPSWTLSELGFLSNLARIPSSPGSLPCDCWLTPSLFIPARAASLLRAAASSSVTRGQQHLRADGRKVPRETTCTEHPRPCRWQWL